MIRRITVLICFLVPVALQAQQPPRAIRRDVPITHAIRRAYDAHTRDTSGRPGPNYWQLRTDYTINVRLDPGTQTLTGTEPIALHNNSPEGLTEIVLPLAHKIFPGLVPRGTSGPPENPHRLGATRPAVNGQTDQPRPPPG